MRAARVKATNAFRLECLLLVFRVERHPRAVRRETASLLRSYRDPYIDELATSLTIHNRRRRRTATTTN